MPEMSEELENEVRNGVQGISQAYDLVGKIKEAMGSPIPARTETAAQESFAFTGQLTDLRYFQTANVMPVSMIQNIPDEQIREAVMDTFNKAIASGKVSMNPERTQITMTDRGRELLNRPTFQSAARADLQKMAERQMQQPIGIMLDGTIQDLGFFQFNDQLDMRNLMQDGKSDTFFKIAQNFQELEKQGYVAIKDTVVTLTEKGKNLITSPMMQSVMQSVTEKALSLIPGVGDVGKIFIATKQIANAAKLGAQVL